MPPFLLIIICCLISFPAIAEDKVLTKLFNQYHINGTMVIAALQSGKTYIHNDTRAKQRFSTASTFKILNSLIALEEKVITKDDILKWDGHIHELPNWNQNQTLETAFKVSCVWCYQELARRIGVNKYREYLHNINYGILHEPFETTTFWLDGALEISALEQIEFLKKVYLRTLPFSVSTYDTLSQIMIEKQTPSFTLRAKTGWATRLAMPIGWYVGYVETKKDVWFFATNLDIRNEKELPLRQKLTQQALQKKGIIQ